MQHSAFDDHPGSWYFTRKQLVEITGMSRDTIDRLERKGRFPKRVLLSDRKVGWKVDEVVRWREDRDRARFARRHSELLSDAPVANSQQQ
jgi:predicted DNA-binding transcriptional regulator AlpA